MQAKDMQREKSQTVKSVSALAIARLRGPSQRLTLFCLSFSPQPSPKKPKYTSAYEPDNMSDEDDLPSALAMPAATAAIKGKQQFTEGEPVWARLKMGFSPFWPAKVRPRPRVP